MSVRWRAARKAGHPATANPLLRARLGNVPARFFQPPPQFYPPNGFLDKPMSDLAATKPVIARRGAAQHDEGWRHRRPMTAVVRNHREPWEKRQMISESRERNFSPASAVTRPMGKFIRPILDSGLPFLRARAGTAQPNAFDAAGRKEADRLPPTPEAASGHFRSPVSAIVARRFFSRPQPREPRPALRLPRLEVRRRRQLALGPAESSRQEQSIRPGVKGQGPNKDHRARRPGLRLHGRARVWRRRCRRSTRFMIDKSG